MREEGGAYDEGRFEAQVALPAEPEASELEELDASSLVWASRQWVKRQVAELRRRRAARSKA
jgi:hypothetical protein